MRFMVRIYSHSESSGWERNYQIAQFSGCGIDAADLAEAFGISEEKVEEYANLLQEGGLKAFIERAD